MMRKFREIKKMKGFMIVLVVVLSFSLVLSFTLMSSPNAQPRTDSGMTKEQAIEYLEEHLNHYNQELEANPNNEEAIVTLAEIHLELADLYNEENQEKQMEHIELSFYFYQKLLELNPDDSEVLTQNAVLAYSTGKDGLAQDYFQQALEIDENDIYVLANYGMFLMNAYGEFELALDYFNKALEQDMDEYVREQIEGLASFSEEMIEILKEMDLAEEESLDEQDY